jgi:hypothetical protein
MPDATRRNFLRQTSIAGSALLLPVLAAAQDKPDRKKEAGKPKGDEGISPAEDLMREHGVLNRILLIYDEHLRMLAAKRTFDGSVLASAADIVKHFVEEYHEKLEEDFLFPRFRKAGKHVKLVDTLQAQHKAGRETTAKIRELAGVATLKYVSTDSEKLADACANSSACIVRTKRAKIPFCSQRSAPSSPPMSTTRWAMTSKRKKTNCSVTKASSKWSIRSANSRKNSESTNWRSSPRNDAPQSPRESLSGLRVFSPRARRLKSFDLPDSQQKLLTAEGAEIQGGVRGEIGSWHRTATIATVPSGSPNLVLGNDVPSALASAP